MTTTTYGSFFNATGSLNPATVVADYISGGDADWREQMEECGAIDAITAEYTDAINTVLPEGISLVGDQFIGPYYTEQAWEDLELDNVSELFSNLNELIEAVDLTAIVDEHDAAAREAATKAVTAAVQTRDATQEKLTADKHAVSDAVRAALRLSVPAANLAAELGLTPARIYQLRDGQR